MASASASVEADNATVCEGTAVSVAEDASVSENIVGIAEGETTFGGHPAGCVSEKKDYGFEVQFSIGPTQGRRREGKAFPFSKHGVLARSKAEEYRTRRSKELGVTKNLVRRHRTMPGVLIMALAGSREAIFDENKYDFVKDLVWTAKPGGDTYYVQAHRQGTTVTMHRILTQERGLVDHKNGHGWDDRMSNLRTDFYNNHNMKIYRTNTSGSNGIIWNVSFHGWNVRWPEGGRRHCKFFGVLPHGDEARKQEQFEAAKAYRTEVDARLGIENGQRPK